EDGIRVYKVTGVQTCALPIYDARVRDVDRGRAISEGERECGRVLLRAPGYLVGLVVHFGEEVKKADRDQDLARGARRAGVKPARSEERRVGKEWRRGWAGEL